MCVPVSSPGLACEVVIVPYTNRKELVRLTGSMCVPVLDDAGVVMVESANIVAYLDAKPGPALRKEPLSVVLEGETRFRRPSVAHPVALVSGSRRMSVAK